jgi:ABC-type Fe3+-hydroxamate transport system substrate-binding protein
VLGRPTAGTQVLVDVDNLDLGRLRMVAAELRDAVTAGHPLRVVVAGPAARVEAVEWPPGAEVVTAGGWQRADAALAVAYTPDEENLVLVSGDGDFSLLAQQHPGAVLVVGTAGSTSARFRGSAAVVDPVHDGLERLRSWLAPSLA